LQIDIPKKDSSFSEEKEAKRLLNALRGRCQRPPYRSHPPRSAQKSLLVLFFRKEPLSSLPCPPFTETTPASS
jgi:hypothetical protein